MSSAAGTAAGLVFEGVAGEGRYRLLGDMSFDTAIPALRQAEPLFRGGMPLVFDLAGVTRADSAGVGLLIEWLRLARQAGCPLHYANLPEPLRAMVRVCGIADMLPLETPPPFLPD